MQNLGKLIALACISLFSINAQCQFISPAMEYNKRIEAVQNISALSTGLMGENVNTYDGSTYFSVTDIDLPGNADLPVRLARHLSVQVQPVTGVPYDTRLLGAGNWDVDVPYIAATFPNQAIWGAQRCSSGSTPPSSIGYFRNDEYWFGISLHLPDRGNSSVLAIHANTPRPSTGGPYRLTTIDRDVFDCIPMKSGLTGEGFRMTSSSGVKYYFDVAVSRSAGSLTKSLITNAESYVSLSLGRTHHYLLASKVEDRFGNTVQYQYDSNGYATRIWSNDGRSIALNYGNGKLTSAVANGQTWSYQYDTNGDLTSVVLPDNSKWLYAYSGTLKPRYPMSPELEGVWEWCSNDSGIHLSSYEISSTHPSGATGVFSFDTRRHYRSGVSAHSCIQEWYDHRTPGPGQGITPLPTYSLVVPYYFDLLSLTQKTLSGPGTETMTWTYNYDDQIIGLWGSQAAPTTYPCTTCPDSKTVTQTNPDGTKLKMRYGILYWVNEGRLLQTEVLDANGTTVRSETIEYLSDADAANQLFYAQYGSLTGGSSSPSTRSVRPAVKRTINQDGNIFKWEVSKSCNAGGATTHCFDIYANPTKITHSSTSTP